MPDHQMTAAFREDPPFVCVFCGLRSDLPTEAYRGRGHCVTSTANAVLMLRLEPFLTTPAVRARVREEMGLPPLPVFA